MVFLRIDSNFLIFCIIEFKLLMWHSQVQWSTLNKKKELEIPIGAIAQLIEHSTLNREVEDSSPSGFTNLLNIHLLIMIN